MTGANVTGMGAVKPQQTAGAALERKNRKTMDELASAFSSVMNQMTSQKDFMPKSSAAETKPVSDTGSAYESYRYKDNSVETAKDPALSQITEDAGEEIAQFSEDVTELTAEELGVSQEAVQEALSQLGYTVFDLLDPQKLADVVMQLSGMDQTELLLSPQFQELFSRIGRMGEDLMQELGLKPQEFEELVLAAQQTETAEGGTVLTTEEELPETPATDAAATEQTENPQGARVIPQEEEAEEASGAQERRVEVTIERENGENASESRTETVQPKERAETDSGNLSQGGSQMDGQTALHTPQQNAVEVPQAAQEPVSYSSVDAMDIIRQIADSVKLVTGTESASIEMQLNPENLGKIYLHISEKEGIVHAQITAQNEVVREALEVQAVNLRESLNQAGVKVDAIEVTVSTHEFEQNLEQNQKREEQKESSREEARTARRNLQLNSLDEMAGLMTEEEALAAQIMKDNGNSVDLTA